MDSSLSCGICRIFRETLKSRWGPEKRKDWVLAWTGSPAPEAAAGCVSWSGEPSPAARVLELWAVERRPGGARRLPSGDSGRLWASGGDSNLENRCIQMAALPDGFLSTQQGIEPARKRAALGSAQKGSGEACGGKGVRRWGPLA